MTTLRMWRLAALLFLCRLLLWVSERLEAAAASAARLVQRLGRRGSAAAGSLLDDPERIRWRQIDAEYRDAKVSLLQARKRFESAAAASGRTVRLAAFHDDD